MGNVRFIAEGYRVILTNMGNDACVLVGEFFEKTDLVGDGGDDVLIVNDSMHVRVRLACLGKARAADARTPKGVNAFVRVLVCGKQGKGAAETVPSDPKMFRRCAG